MRSIPLELGLKTKSGKDSNVYDFGSVHGIEKWDTIRPQEIHLMNEIHVENTSAVLSVDSRIGVIGCVLGDRASSGRVLMTESNARASLVSEYNRRKNMITNAETMISSNLKEDCLRKYDIAIYIPKKSDPPHLIREKIFDIAPNMRTDSKLYFSAQKETVDRYRDFLERFGEISEKIHGSSKVLEIKNPERPRRQGFLDYRNVEHDIKGASCRFKLLEGFTTQNGRNAVEMLSRELEPEKNEEILDLSGNFGGLGIFSYHLGNSKPNFITRNTYIRDTIKENCILNDVDDFSIKADDGPEGLPESSIDKIGYYINPSKPDELINYDLREAKRIIKSDGRIYVCHKREHEIIDKLEMYFRNIKVSRRELDQQVLECF